MERQYPEPSIAMDNEFRAIYGRLYEDFQGPRIVRPLLEFPPYVRPGLHRAIAEAIDEACKREGVDLRPDARYFLAVNFYHMIAVPVAIRDGEGGAIPTPAAVDLIRADCTEIVRAAREKYGHEEISGRAMLETCARVYERLKVAASNVWG